MRKKEMEALTAIVDTREQIPLDLERHGFRVRRETLPFGDYSLAYPDMRTSLVIERKSLADFVMCIGRERARFQKELIALRGFPYRAVICEFNLSDIANHNYRSMIDEKAVMSTIAKWLNWGIPFIMCGDADNAAYLVAAMLRDRAKHLFRYARQAVAIEEGIAGIRRLAVEAGV